MFFRKINATGRLPVLEDRGTVIADHREIVRYLETLVPEPPLLPAQGDPRDRAWCHLLENWADESLYFFDLWFRFGVSANAGEWSDRASQSESPMLRAATKRALTPVMRGVLRAQGIGRMRPEKIMDTFQRHLEALETLLLSAEWLVGDHLTIADIAVYSQLAGSSETDECVQALAEHRPVLEWMERVNTATRDTGV